MYTSTCISNLNNFSTRIVFYILTIKFLCVRTNHQVIGSLEIDAFHRLYISLFYKCYTPLLFLLLKLLNLYTYHCGDYAYLHCLLPQVDDRTSVRLRSFKHGLNPHGHSTLVFPRRLFHNFPNCMYLSSARSSFNLWRL